MSTEPNDNTDEQDKKATGTTGEPVCEIPTHEQMLTRLQKERDQFEDQLKRAMADTANMRRRQQKEVEDAHKRALEGLCQELLPVLDNFSMALKAFDEQADNVDPKALVDGVRMVRALLGGALERHGVQEIPAAGKAFDPNLHEAVNVEPRADLPPGQVTQVLQTGYQLGDRVIRPSRVLVSGPPPAGDAGR